MAGARTYQQLECWQLANELKRAVYKLLESSPRACADQRFHMQLKDSAGSGPANLAEAFAYYEHPDSRRFARFAKGSLTETQNHLLDGVDSQYWTQQRVDSLLLLARRAVGATTGWIRHLSTTKAPPAHWERDQEASATTRRSSGYSRKTHNN